jgi:hypothetical protein
VAVVVRGGIRQTIAAYSASAASGRQPRGVNSLPSLHAPTARPEVTSHPLRL